MYFPFYNKLKDCYISPLQISTAYTLAEYTDARPPPTSFISNSHHVVALRTSTLRSTLRSESHAMEGAHVLHWEKVLCGLACRMISARLLPPPSPVLRVRCVRLYLVTSSSCILLHQILARTHGPQSPTPDIYIYIYIYIYPIGHPPTHPPTK